MFAILITQFYGNLNVVRVPHPPTVNSFSYEWGVNFKFKFFKNIEYKFNRYMPCITHSVLLHAYLKRSQILLTLSNHQVICGVFSIFPLCRSYM